MAFNVTLGGIPIHLDSERPAAGKWRAYLRSLDGWDGRAQDGTDASAHWSGQGQVAGATGSEARQITMGVLILGSDIAGGTIRDALDAFGRLGRTTFTAAEDDRALVRTADVRVIQMPDSRVSRLCTQVTFSLTADDSLRYSAESRTITNGANLLPNRGGAIAFGRLNLTGPHGAITITHPGGVWTFPALAAGSRLIDFSEGEVWNGNVRVFGAAAGPAPRVLPGGSGWTVSGLGAGSAVVTRCEAWA